MKTRNVLIIDNSLSIHKAYTAALKRYKGIKTKVLHSFNGQDALEQLAKVKDIALILLDIKLPGMDGLEFLKQLNGKNINQKIPIIIVTKEDKKANLIKGFKLGAMAFLTKPLQRSHLYDLMDKILKDDSSNPSISHLIGFNSKFRAQKILAFND